MERNKLIALVVSIILGFFAVVAVKMYIDKEQKKTIREVTPVRILVAADNLKRGQKISQTDLTTKYWPEENLHKEMILSSEKEKVLNTVINQPIGKGQPFLTFYIDKKAESSGVSSPVQNTWRAITVPVTDITGVSGLIKPQDQVDIIWTTGKMVKETRVLMSKVTVVAVGQKLHEQLYSVPNAVDVSYNTLTLKVTQKESKFLTYAIATGTLTFVLRRREDPSMAIDSDSIVEGDRANIEKLIKEIQQTRLEGVK